MGKMSMKKAVVFVIGLAILVYACSVGPAKGIRESAFQVVGGVTGPAIQQLAGKPEPTTVKMILPSPTAPIAGEVVTTSIPPTPAGPTATPGPSALEQAKSTGIPIWEGIVSPFIRDTWEDAGFTLGNIKSIIFGPSRGVAFQHLFDKFGNSLRGLFGLVGTFWLVILFVKHIVLRLLSSGVKSATPRGVQKSMKVRLSRGLSPLTFDLNLPAIIMAGLASSVWILVQMSVVKPDGIIYFAGQILTIFSSILGVILTTSKLFSTFRTLVEEIWGWGQKSVSVSASVNVPILDNIFSGAASIIGGLIRLGRLILAVIVAIILVPLLLAAGVEVYALFIQSVASVFEVDLATPVITRLAPLASGAPEVAAAALPREANFVARILHFGGDLVTQFFALFMTLNQIIFSNQALVSVIALGLFMYLVYHYRPFAPVMRGPAGKEQT